MMKWNSIFLSKKATLILVIIVEKESFMSAIPIQKTLSKEELYTLIQNYQKNHDQKSKEMIILSNTKLVLSLMKRFYQKSNHWYQLSITVFNVCSSFDHWWNETLFKR